jgi:hypothetical protein
MGRAIGIRTGRWACGFAIGVTLVAVAPTAAIGRDHLTREVARNAARKAVEADPTYRIIDSQEPLRTRHCWRAPGKVMRCSLYRRAPTPCALQGDSAPDALCVQVLARRSWLVEVGPREPAGAPLHAKILRIVDGPA